MNKTTHAIQRTSPKGEKFVGTCSLCGQKGLTTANIGEPCPNVRGLSQDEALIEAIDPKPATSIDELEMHAHTARKLLNNPEWTPTRLLWSRLLGHLEAAIRLSQP